MLIDQANVARDALSGRVAVVTGAGQGIGKETARILARLGAAVAIAELVATGLVGTILYAAEFHGQETSTGPGLTKLGLTAAGEPRAAAPAGGAAPAPADGGGAGRGPG